MLWFYTFLCIFFFIILSFYLYILFLCYFSCIFICCFVLNISIQRFIFNLVFTAYFSLSGNRCYKISTKRFSKYIYFFMKTGPNDNYNGQGRHFKFWLREGRRHFFFIVAKISLTPKQIGLIFNLWFLYKLDLYPLLKSEDHSRDESNLFQAFWQELQEEEPAKYRSSKL